MLEKIKFLKSHRKFSFAFLAIIAFWYLSLFPGRLGYDYSLAIKMIQQGKSTDWWTSLFFWYLKISSFNGNSIFVPALLGLISLAFSLVFLISAFSQSLKVRMWAVIVISLTPLFGVFGVTVSHDVFQTAGIIILVGVELRFIQKMYISNPELITVILIAFIFLLSVKTGPFFILFGLISLAIRKKVRIILITMPFIVILYFASSIGVSTDFMKDTKYYPMIADLKCIAQHPEAEITSDEWKFLEQIAPKQIWVEELSCSTVGSASNVINSPDFQLNLNGQFWRNYFGITSKNPAIFMMAHLQRSRGALPPPFFQGPENQVSYDINLPIGFGTNTALQSGPELLHPSIDEPSVDINIRILKPLEFFAQSPTFLVNQASWFWGWGGIWLIPIMYFWVKNFKNSKISTRLISLYPIYLLHLSLIILTPGALGRYYMSTILIGVTASIVILLEFFAKVQNTSSGDEQLI